MLFNKPMGIKRRTIILGSVLLAALPTVWLACRALKSDQYFFHRLIDEMDASHVIKSPLMGLRENFITSEEDLSGKWRLVSKPSHKPIDLWAAPTQYPLFAFKESEMPEGMSLTRGGEEIPFAVEEGHSPLNWRWLKGSYAFPADKLNNYKRKLKCAVIGREKPVSFSRILPGGEAEIVVNAKKDKVRVPVLLSLYLDGKLIQTQEVTSMEYRSMLFKAKVAVKNYRFDFRAKIFSKRGKAEVHVKSIEINASHDLVLLSAPRGERVSVNRDPYRVFYLSQKLHPGANHKNSLSYLTMLGEVYSQFPLDDLGVVGNPYLIKKKILFNDTALNSLFAPPESHFQFEVELPEASYLEFGCGILEKSWEQKSEAVEFKVLLEEGGKQHELFYQHMDPSNHPDQRRIGFYKIDLSSYKKKKAKISLITRGQSTNAKKEQKDFGLCFWVNPLLYTSIEPFFGKNARDTNIILISIDTLRADRLGCYGYRGKISPQIDSLAKDSVVFENAFAQSNWTLPSHVSLLTSLNPYHHQVYLAHEKMSPSLVTVADILRANQYVCAAITGGGYVSERFGFSKGFDSYKGERLVFHAPNEAEELQRHALAWLERNQDKKFFLFLHTYQVHDPYYFHKGITEAFLEGEPLWESMPLPAFFRKQPEKRKYKFSRRERDNIIALYEGEIRYTDEFLIKPVVHKLKELDLYDRTMIVFTSDHGEELLDHKRWLHGHTLYNELIKVPLIIKFPGSKYSTKRSKIIVRSIDVVPTLLEEAGIDFAPFDFDGQSLLDIIKGREKKHRTYISDFSRKDSSDLRPTMVSTNRDYWKIIINRKKSPPKIFLYDFNSDPLEKHNLENSKGQLARSLFNLILEHYDHFRKVLRKSEKVEMDEELRQRLRALGYVQ